MSVCRCKDSKANGIDGDQDIEDLYQAQVERNKEGLSILSQDEDMIEAIDRWIARKKFSKLLDLWVKGLDLDWNKLYGDNKPQRISLPTYPFARERYWIDAKVNGQPRTSGMTTVVLHPLLHINTSDLSQQSYSSTFSGEEFFLTDHQVNTDDGSAQKVLPAVAYLEMARVAVEKAMPTRQESSILELHNTVWAQPIVVTENKQVTIALFANDNEQIDYEIYSTEAEQEIIHCQGQAVFSNKSLPAKLDIEQ